MTLQEYIIEFRKEHKLSQRQFSSIANLSNSYLAIIENNYNPKTGKPPIISLLTIKKLASAMGLSLQELTDIIDNQEIADYDEAVLSEDERHLIQYYRDMTLSQKNLLLSVASEISK